MENYTRFCDIKAKGTWSLAENSFDIIAVKAKNIQEKTIENYKAHGCRYSASLNVSSFKNQAAFFSTKLQ